jgi:hypothetical protein
MTADTTIEWQQPRSFSVDRGWYTLASRALLVLLPVVLALVGYYRAQLAREPLPRPQGDAAFYAYQLQRAAECHGQWWRIADDPRLGHPYPTEFAKHPGLYEGVDLMLLASLFGNSFSAAWTYHLAILAALAFNGWIAAWIVFRTTRSTLWAAAAVALVTLNEPTAGRILGHLHLFKFGWFLIAVWSFAAFLKWPTWRRGLLLGLAAALVLQSSFYLGFLMLLGLAFWYCLEAVSGRVFRDHVTATLAAIVAFVVLAVLFCFPLWTNYTPIVGADQYFQRTWSETWTFGSELWKYVVPKSSWLGGNYFRDLRHQSPPPPMEEGWNFPGYTVLFTLLVAVVALLRRSELSKKLHPFVFVSLGLMAFWTILSLAGGPSALVFHAIPSFRCYGRAGLLVVALGSVVAPIVANDLVRICHRGPVRVILTLGLLALVATDARRAAVSFSGWPADSRIPEWVGWLKEQPPDEQLAVFMPHPVARLKAAEAHRNTKPFYWWGIQSLEWLPLHGHAALCGGDFTLFEGDLRLLGASYDQINPAGLRYLASFGYEKFAFHSDYLAANPWISKVPWLEAIDDRGEWHFYRAGADSSRFPINSLAQILDRARSSDEPHEAPAGCWITGSWPVSEDTIVDGIDWALLAWTDEHGRLLTPPKPAFFQHVFGPGIPAYTIRTPDRTGSYHLAVLDRWRNPRATVPYRIVPNMAASQPTFPPRRPEITVHSVPVPVTTASAHSPAWEITLANTSSVYIQAQVFRHHLSTVSQTHPGLRSQWPEASDGGIVLRFSPDVFDELAGHEFQEVPLPRDLAPGDRLKITVPADRLPAGWASLPLTVEPSFARVGGREVSAQTADLKIAVEEASSVIARTPSESEDRKR